MLRVEITFTDTNVVGWYYDTFNVEIYSGNSIDGYELGIIVDKLFMENLQYSGSTFNIGDIYKCRSFPSNRISGCSGPSSESPYGIICVLFPDICIPNQ